MKSTHIVLLGSNFTHLSPYIAEEMGVAIINGSEPSVSVREMAVHSANGEIALPTIICILRVAADKYAEVRQLHPAIKEVPDCIMRAVWELEKAKECFTKWRVPEAARAPKGGVDK
jgi:hypothetical protein